MVTMVQVAEMVRRYFAERNIPTNGMTVVLDFSDLQPWAQADAAISRELRGLNREPQSISARLPNLKIAGMSFRLEGPGCP